MYLISLRIKTASTQIDFVTESVQYIAVDIGMIITLPIRGIEVVCF